MTHPIPIQNKRRLALALKAIDEGRLWWRVTDQHGRPCNGGYAEPLRVRVWSETIDSPRICERGWHVTSAPIRWRGQRIWLVEVGGECGGENGDKSCWSRIRPLAEVDPSACIDPVIMAATMRPNLSGANLNGANLNGANLNGANLSGADLSGADLYRANLYGANLNGANLNGANLFGADLYGANLNGANLNGANLTGASLSGADLYGADLYRANLTGASLSGADLGEWERGPDGYARRKAT